MSRSLLAVLLVIGCRGALPLGAPGNDAASGETRPSAESAETGSALPDAPGPPDAQPDSASTADLAVAIPDLSLAVPDAPPPADLADLTDLVDSASDEGDAPAAGPGMCEPAPASQFTACFQRTPAMDYFRRKDGRQCGLCTITKNGSTRPVTHCLYGDEKDYLLYCAKVCTDCCHTQRGASCESAADCCLPLSCATIAGRKICDTPPP